MSLHDECKKACGDPSGISVPSYSTTHNILNTVLSVDSDLLVH